MNEKFALSIAKITKLSALAAFNFAGIGDPIAADSAAVTAMRDGLNSLKISGNIAIGEGERDKAPMLYCGERVGLNKHNSLEVDFAVDPLECTEALSKFSIKHSTDPKYTSGSMSVIAAAPHGAILHAPDVYMEKIATGLHFSEKIVSLENSIKENIKNIALAKKCAISALRAVVLDRERHVGLIEKLKELGVSVSLIKDGDICAAISTMKNVDVYLGIGGAPEGVIAAGALRILGGQICARLIFNTDIEKERGKNFGITDFSKIYYTEDLVKKDAIFATTGITNGSLVDGIVVKENLATTHTLLMVENHMIKKIVSHSKFSPLFTPLFSPLFSPLVNDKPSCN